MVSHTADLAVDFGRKVRNIVDCPAYKEIFPCSYTCCGLEKRRAMEHKHGR
jgi:hypothetical protein